MSDEDATRYVMEVDIPDDDSDTVIEILGLGLFQNGKSYEITESEAANYKAVNVAQDYNVDPETHAILGSKIIQGPSLLVAARNMHGVRVATADGADVLDEDVEDEPSEAVAEPEPEPVSEPAEVPLAHNGYDPEGGNE